MVKTLTLELLRDYWLLHEPSIQYYSQIAQDLLLGKEIPVGLFGSLALPDVPENMALVTMAGVLTKADVCGAQGSRSLTKQVNAAAAAHSIDSIIVLSEGCPGGQADGVEELANAISSARERKPVLGVVSGMACSAGYWPLTQCDEIHALSETTVVGCIGVVARMRNPKKVDADKEDIIEVYSDLSPDKNIEARDVSAYKQQVINPMAEVFHNAVRAGRGKRLKLDKENVLSGKTYLAKYALEYGMIDGIMPMNKIIQRANFLSKNRK